MIELFLALKLLISPVAAPAADYELTGIGTSGFTGYTVVQEQIVEDVVVEEEILEERQPIDWQYRLHVVKVLCIVAFALVALLFAGIILSWIYFGVAWVVDEVVSFFRLIF